VSSRIVVRLLGPVDVVDRRGATIGLGTRKQRALLTILALARGQVVSVDRLIEELWGHDAPAHATSSLYSYMSNLRRILEPSRDVAPTVLVTSPPGYRLSLTPEELDVVAFEHAAVRVSTLAAEQQWAEARTLAESALQCWRGEALGEFADEPFAAPDATRLEELRRVMIEDLFEARVEMNDAQVIADIERFARDHPLRERCWALLMRSLYAAGRQADALRAFQRARGHLMETLGIEPGPQLRELEHSILHQDRELQVTLPRSSTPAARTDPSPAADATASATVSRTPLVGRDAELASCRAVLDETLRGPRAIIVEGEPGIGKTRLIEELADVARARGMSVLWGRSLDGAASPALWPWLPPLRALIARDDTVAHRHPELVALLAAGPDSSSTAHAHEVARFALFDAIVDLIHGAARASALMIVIDDLHWADTASLELVTTLATRLSHAGVLLAVTTRQLDVGRNDIHVTALAALTRMAGSRRLELRGLDHDHTTQLLHELTGGPVDHATTDMVLRRAEGNPFFTTEIARLLARRPAQQPMTDLPYGIRDVITRRLDPLPPDTLDLLRTGAVIGRDFDIDLLTRASGHRHLLDTLEMLEPAVLQRLITHVDEHPGTYRYAHTLIREVLISNHTPLQLAKTHLRIADTLDNDHDTAEIVAEHLWSALPLSTDHRTARQLELAARTAMTRGAFEAAQHHLDRAITLTRNDSGASDAEGRVRALTMLSSASVFHRGFVATAASPAVARARPVRYDGSDDVHEVFLRSLEFARHLRACEFALADPIAGELRAIADASDDPLIRSLGHAAYGYAVWYRGHLTDAAEHVRIAVEALDHPDSRPERLPDDAAQVLNLPAAIGLHISDIMGVLEDPSQATHRTRIRRPADTLWTMVASLYGSLGALMVGDAERAIREAGTGVAHDPDGTFGAWSDGLRICLVASRCMSGETVDGASILQVLDERYEYGTQRATLSIIIAALSMGLSHSGQTEHAAQAARLARDEVGPYGDLYPEPIVLLAEAMVAASLPDGSEPVSRLLNRAMVITERQGARAVTAHVQRVALSLGQPGSTVS
jgi:DNA-binding SARP family transcriptional activator